MPAPVITLTVLKIEAFCEPGAERVGGVPLSRPHPLQLLFMGIFEVPCLCKRATNTRRTQGGNCGGNWRLKAGSLLTGRSSSTAHDSTELFKKERNTSKESVI